MNLMFDKYKNFFKTINFQKEFYAQTEQMVLQHSERDQMLIESESWLTHGEFEYKQMMTQLYRTRTTRLILVHSRVMNVFNVNS